MPKLADIMKVRVSLLGERAVGKTSVIRRFVFNEFDDRYVQTLGARVSRKAVGVEVEGRTVQVVLTIVDIMGEPSFRDLLKEAYFHEVQGIVAVADLTRPETVAALPEWVAAARGVSGPVPIVVLGNKVDLPAADGAVDALQAISSSLQSPCWQTSSKTGANVEAAFVGLARAVVEDFVHGPGGKRVWPGPMASA